MISGRKIEKFRNLNSVIEKWVEVKEITLNEIIALDQ